MDEVGPVLNIVVRLCSDEGDFHRPRIPCCRGWSRIRSEFDGSLADVLKGRGLFADAVDDAIRVAKNAGRQACVFR